MTAPQRNWGYNCGMKDLSNIVLSMLDLVAVREGAGVDNALHIALRTAQHAESLGFTRYWVAEHHNMVGIASSATAVTMGYLAGGTSRIRIGSGGIMLPNHAPLVVAEAIGTLAALYPNRIDLGLGRAPGTDGPTMRALRRDRVESEQDFPRDVMELQRLLGPTQPGQRLVATPGANSNVPIWLLGSSLFSAQLAGELGLPYTFAAHFAPRLLLQALAVYRQSFKPSAQCAKPYAAVAIQVVASDTDAQADYLASSLYQRVHGIITGQRGKLPRPVDHYLEGIHPQERAAVEDFLAAAAIGSPETVQQRLQQIADLTQADEFIIACDVFDIEQRLKSLDITAAVMAHATTPAL